jgi:WS/DGAT/MGAT family acyltransferase
MSDGPQGTTSEDRMSDFEALMWNLEKDPRLSSNIANLSMLDRSPNMARLTARIERASILFPRLRQKVTPTLGRLAPPRWQLDPDFDLSYHLRRVSLAGRGTRAELHELVTALFTTPFDRTRPLWEFVVIDGLRGGKAAMLQRLHHTITDGEGGLRLSMEFIDFERDAPEPDALVPPTANRSEGSLIGSVGDAVSHVARRQMGIARRTLDGTLHAVTHPTSIGETGGAVVATARSALRQAQLGEAPMSPLWTERTLHRAYDTLDVPFAEAKAAARALGGTLNDFFVCGAAAGAGAYHRQLGAPVEQLRMAMPISTRSDRSVGGNLFSPSQTLVPTGAMSPAERFDLVRTALMKTKGEPMMGVADAMAGLINLLPTSVLTRTGARIAGSIDFVTSNLRAAPVDVFLAGSLMEANYPMGPLASTAFNITTMSYRGNFNMGVVIDTGAIHEPKRLLDSLKRSYKELLDAAT